MNLPFKCNSIYLIFFLDTFERVPQPAQSDQYKYICRFVRYRVFFLRHPVCISHYHISISRFGTHAIVCCPGYSSTAIFFPGPPDQYPEYEAGEEYYEYDYGPSYDNYDYVVPEIPKVFLKKKIRWSPITNC